MVGFSHCFHLWQISGCVFVESQLPRLDCHWVVFRWKNPPGRLIEKIKDQVSEDEAGKAFGMMEDWKEDEMSLECFFWFLKDWYHWYPLIEALEWEAIEEKEVCQTWGMMRTWCWMPQAPSSVIYPHHVLQHWRTRDETTTLFSWLFMISRCSNIHLDWSIAVFQLGIPGINVPRYPMIY